MSEPSARAAGSSAGPSQGRDGVVALSCARAGAGPSSRKSGATCDSAKPRTAARPAIFGTPINSPSLPPNLGALQVRRFCLSAGATSFARSARCNRHRGESTRLFRRLDCARTEHISCLIFDKPACVPDDACTAAGEELVNTATATPAEAMPAKHADRLIDMRVTAIRYAARDTNLYEFAPLDGKPLPTYEPGAHIDLHLPNGLIRQYSLIRAEPDPSSYSVTVKRDPASRGGSRYVHDELRVGRTLKISAPRNNFPLVEDAGHVVLLAGGIGITPIWCMVQRLHKLGRSFKLHYACRSRADTAFLQALETIGHTQFHFDDENGDKVLDIKPIVSAAAREALLYCGGPMPMLHAFEAATADWPREQIHVEYFTPKPGAEEKKGGFVVELARSGQEFVIPAGKSILQVLLD